MPGEQLSLQLYLPISHRLSNFVYGANEQAVQSLLHHLQNPGSGNFLIYGPEASGKSHLLAGACHWASEHILTSAYLPMKELKSYGVSLFEGLESLYCLAVDDIQEIAADRAWEVALFSLINRVEHSQSLLVLASNTAPGALPWSLPDLRSRIGAALIYRLEELSEQDKRGALRRMAADRGLTLSDAILEYLFSRRSRGMHELVHSLQKLDEQSLSQKRRLTLPFVKSVLGE